MYNSEYFPLEHLFIIFIFCSCFERSGSWSFLTIPTLVNNFFCFYKMKVHGHWVGVKSSWCLYKYIVVCTTNKACFADLSFTFCSLQKAGNSYSSCSPLLILYTGTLCWLNIMYMYCCCLHLCLIIWKFDTSSICLFVHVIFFMSEFL